MNFRGAVFNFGDPSGSHERCPHISRKGKPCKKPAGHGRHIMTEGTTNILGFDYHWIRLAYICECGFASSRRDDFKKWHDNKGRLLMLGNRKQVELKEFYGQVYESPETVEITDDIDLVMTQ